MEWKWSKGEPYERTKRTYKTKDADEHAQVQVQVQYNKDLEVSAYSSSLHYDENTWNILNETVATNGFKVSNKRESLDQKMADRDKMQQIGFNPFLSQTNYAEDITIRDQYLKPINTTEGRIKAESNH
jgi:hypothetical protein